MYTSKHILYIVSDQTIQEAPQGKTDATLSYFRGCRLLQATFSFAAVYALDCFSACFKSFLRKLLESASPSAFSAGIL